MSVQVYRSATGGEAEIHFAISDRVLEGVVSVVGAFNDWTPGLDVFVLRSDGTREAVVTVAGTHDVRFRYLCSGGMWFDDASADEVDERGCLIRLTTMASARSAEDAHTPDWTGDIPTS